MNGPGSALSPGISFMGQQTAHYRTLPTDYGNPRALPLAASRPGDAARPAPSASPAPHTCGDHAMTTAERPEAAVPQPPAPAGPPEIPDALTEALLGVGGASGLRRFPRPVIESLGRQGVFRRRWRDGAPGDVRYGTRFAEEASRQAPTGVAVGLGVHAEPVLAMLSRFACDSPYLAELRERALDGTAIGCVGASEAAHGSDISSVECMATRVPGGWQVRGAKKYVSLGAVADFVIAVCRLADEDGQPTRRLAALVIPREQAETVRIHEKVGAHALDTA